MWVIPHFPDVGQGCYRFNSTFVFPLRSTLTIALNASFNIVLPVSPSLSTKHETLNPQYQHVLSEIANNE
jgi:hypothetical protein